MSTPQESLADVHARYTFGDDTTDVTTPDGFGVRLAEESDQPEYQDTATFIVSDEKRHDALYVTASHFSSGNRGANLERFKAIIRERTAEKAATQIVMGDINTEVKSAAELQALADETGMVVIVPGFKIRRLRGLQDQLHKRMDRKDDFDSMFVAIAPGLVDAPALDAVPHQCVAWPSQPERLRWLETADSDVAQAWMDDRILTDHAVVKCPMTVGVSVTLGNAARANYDKYDIKNQARVDRLTYLRGQEIIETSVADCVIRLVGALPVSETLSAEQKAQTLDALRQYRADLPTHYAAAHAVWSDQDDLCSVGTPLGQAMAALGKKSKQFVTITRALSWRDLEAASTLREVFKSELVGQLLTGLGLEENTTGPLSGRTDFDRATFRTQAEAKIDAAWERIIKRQSAGDLYKMWFAELLHGQTTGGMPIPGATLSQPTEHYIATRMQALGLSGTICVMVEALR